MCPPFCVRSIPVVSRQGRTLFMLNDVAQTFDFSGAEVSDLVPYVTNDAVTLEDQPAVRGGVSVSYELSPRSVTTFVRARHRRRSR